MNVHELLLQWHVTERCNFRCAHCYQEGYAGEELPLDGLLSLLEQFSDLLARRRRDLPGLPYRGRLTLTGGEPFVRDDFLAFLERIAARKPLWTFSILTNGSLIDDVLAERLARLGPSFVQVSIDGTPSTNDRLRTPGAHEGAVRALQSLVRRGISTFISFTAQRGNYREFADVARLGCELGVTRVWADRLIPSGSGAELAGELLTPEETRELFEIMVEARAEAEDRFGRTQVSLGRALQFLVGGGRPYHCAAGDRLITLQPNGDVLPCRRMPIVVGNALRTSLLELYYNNAVLRRLREHNAPSRGCEDCRYALQCGGGLRCLSYALTGDPLSADPGCWHAHGSGAGDSAMPAGAWAAACHPIPDVTGGP